MEISEILVTAILSVSVLILVLKTGVVKSRRVFPSTFSSSNSPCATRSPKSSLQIKLSLIDGA